MSPHGAAGEPSPNAAWAASLVGGLVRSGVREVVISPGARSAPLALALADHATRQPTALRLQVVIDERAAAFLALGMARAAGRPVALLTTSGTAGAHALPAVIEASLSAVPLLILTADRPEELQGCGAPQTVDQQRLFGAHVRWFAHLGAPRPGGPAGWPAALAARAVQRAVGPPAGPVHLNLAFREPLWTPGQEPSNPAPAPWIAHAPAAPSPAQARDALELLLGADGGQRGVIVAGPRALAPGEDPAPVLALARRLGWPIVADPLSGLRASDDAQVIACADALLRDPECAVALAPEAALRLGQLPTSKTLQGWLAPLAPRSLLVDPQADWHDPTHSAGGLLVASTAATCAALLSEARLRPAPASWLVGWQRAEAAARGALEAATGEGWWEGALARLVARALPPGALLQAGSSLPIRDLDAFGGAGPATLVGQRGANGIDGGIAAAAGAALVWETGPVAALIGDVALVHDLSGLAAACELGAPLLLVVADNGGGGIFEHLPLAKHPTHFERLFLTPPRLDLTRACAGLGAEVESIEDRAACARALTAALARPLGGPRVLVCRLPRTESRRRREAAWAAVSEAWRAWRAPTPEEVPCPSMSP